MSLFFGVGTLRTENRFTSQKLDETGLYYYGARYYDPELGQFVSPGAVNNERRNASEKSQNEVNIKPLSRLFILLTFALCLGAAQRPAQATAPVQLQGEAARAFLARAGGACANRRRRAERPAAGRPL